MNKNRTSLSDRSGMVCQKSILIYRMQLKFFYILKLLFLACLASHYLSTQFMQSMLKLHRKSNKDKLETKFELDNRMHGIPFTFYRINYILDYVIADV